MREIKWEVIESPFHYDVVTVIARFRDRYGDRMGYSCTISRDAMIPEILIIMWEEVKRMRDRRFDDPYIFWNWNIGSRWKQDREEIE